MRSQAQVSTKVDTQSSQDYPVDESKKDWKGTTARDIGKMIEAQKRLSTELAEISDDLEDLDDQEPLNREEQRLRSELLSDQYRLK